MPIPKQVPETAAQQLMRALVQTESPWVNLMKRLLTPEACQHIFDYVRINGDTEVNEAIHIFRASRDGWSGVDFHRLCDGQGPTLCLVQSEEDYMSAGFTSKAWTSPKKCPDVEDASACVFALTGTLQVFKTKNPKEAVRHHRWYGPGW